MKLQYIVITFFFLVSSINSQSITDKINKVLSNQLFESCTASISVYDLTNNEKLYGKNEKLLMRPASNLKLFTSIAGLLFLGPDYKFKTSFYHTGEIIDSVCNGDVYVVGGFDPEFSSTDLDSVINSIKNLGVRKITGNLYGDISLMDSLYWGEGWMWDDNPYLYSPYLSPLTINKNGIKVAYEPIGVAFPVKVDITPNSKFYTVLNSSVTILEDTSSLQITRDYFNNTNEISITGNLSFKAKPDTTELNLVHPEKYFLTLFAEGLNNAGITFYGSVDTTSLPGDASNIFTFERPYKEIITNLNKESDNLNAELTLRTLACECVEKPASAQNGIKMIDSLITLTGLDYSEYRIADGSGLSFYNLVSAEALMELLKYIYFNKKDLFEILYESLPVAGVDGSLQNRLPYSSTKGNVRAKTGTISGVSCLSGYLTSTDNHLIAFSIMIQNYIGSSGQARDIQDDICKILSEIKNGKL